LLADVWNCPPQHVILLNKNLFNLINIRERLIPEFVNAALICIDSMLKVAKWFFDNSHSVFNTSALLIGLSFLQIFHTLDCPLIIVIEQETLTCNLDSNDLIIDSSVSTFRVICMLGWATKESYSLLKAPFILIKSTSCIKELTFLQCSAKFSSTMLSLKTRKLKWHSSTLLTSSSNL
jgi:hypothetical protein